MKLITICIATVAMAISITAAPDKTPNRAAPTVVCTSDKVRDQDDMCIWVHPTDKSLSTVIAADKAAGRLFVYDLSGKVLQNTPMHGAANIDLRYDFPLGGEKVDIVAMNIRRGGFRIAVFKVDPKTRKITRVDNKQIKTSDNYGGTMYRSAKTGKFYFVTTSMPGIVEQFELSDDGNGKVRGVKVRSWKSGFSEGAVGDDIAGKIYIGQEDKGVWEIGGEPTDPTPGKLILKVGTCGLKADVEGLAIYRFKGGKEGYLLVSNQGAHNFKVFDLAPGHKLIATFAVNGSQETDGIAVTNVNLGGKFDKGLFACHSNRKKGGGCPVLLTPWSDIAAIVSPQLKTDTSWNPRKP
ncbi:MAG: phytase [Phycisphaerae bacterium]|nr:phytase [Phycisphaerae bacterium]